MGENSTTIEPGIRKKPNGKYVVTKSIEGKRYYKETNTLPEARKWKKYFIPIANDTALTQLEAPAASFKLNGKDFKITFKEAWEDYLKRHLSTKGEMTQYKAERRITLFAASIMKMRLCEINEDTLTAVIEERKRMNSNPQRCNFNAEYKMLHHFFKWYAKYCDSYFKSPLQEFHRNIGRVKDTPDKPKHIPPNEVQKFMDALPLFWRRFALFQFYMAGRVQEPAGLQWHCIDRVKRKIRVQYVMTWLKSRPKLKSTPKTDTVSHVYINDHMMQLLDELEEEKVSGCHLVFHNKGMPLVYNDILEVYNATLEKIGSAYRGTHILRYGMAGFSGEVLGDEGSKAATRHGSMAMARKYRGKVRVFELTDENKKVVTEAQQLFSRKA